MAGLSSERPLRVLHIITRFIVGGAMENTLLTVIGQDRDPRYEVTLLAGIDRGPEGTLDAHAVAAGVEFVSMPWLVREVDPRRDARALSWLVGFIRKGEYELVHTHCAKAGVLGRLAAAMVGVPCVVHTFHSLPFHDHQSAAVRAFYKGVLRACDGFTDGYISVCDNTRRRAIEAGVGKASKHRTVYSGMDLRPFLNLEGHLSAQEAKRRLGIPPHAQVVGKVARLFALKGHEHFLDAMAMLAPQHPDMWLLLVGGGQRRAELEARVRQLGLSQRTVFTGLVDPTQIPACIGAMDVLVHTSLREGLARVLPQASAAAKPVVTFDLDGAPEAVLDGQSGFLCRPGDVSDVAGRVSELLNSPEKCQRFGAVGRRWVSRRWQTETMVKEINAFYQTLMVAKGKARDQKSWCDVWESALEPEPFDGFCASAVRQADSNG